MVAVGVLSFEAYATFTASQTDQQQFAAGTITLALANETNATVNYNLDATLIAPGDTMQRAAKLTFGGSLATKSLSISAALHAGQASNVLWTDETNGLQIQIDECSQPWDETVNSGIPTYNCAGTPNNVLASQAIHALNGSPAVLDGSNHLNIGAGGVNHLLFTFSLPSSAGNTFQGLALNSGGIDLSFTATQRDGTNR
jgi:hypothetical protein